MTLVESWRKHRLVWLFVAILCVHVQAQNPVPVLESAHPPNAAGQEKKPYVVLLSLDGFRYDYAERYHAKNLQSSRNSGSKRSAGDDSDLSVGHFSHSLFDRNWTLSRASRNRRDDFLRSETQAAIRLQ
jgi:hypothetical protein